MPLKYETTPVPVADLRRMVEENLGLALKAQDGDPIDLCDHVQLASLSHQSLRFDVELETGARGCLEVVEGEIWNARAEGVQGREALTLLFGTRCRKLGSCRLEERPRERQLAASTGSLLSEVATAAEARELRESKASPAAEAPRSPQAREDAAAARWCRKVVEEAAGVRCCRLLEIGNTGAVARWPASDGDGEEKQVVRAVLALFRPHESTASRAPGGTVEEVSVAWPAGLEFFKRVSAGRVLVLSTGGSGRSGLAWLALRRAAAGLAASPALEPSAPAGAGGGAPLPRELDPALDRAAARIATGIAGARCCAVVRRHDPTVRGASHANAPELACFVLARAAALFSMACGEAGEEGQAAREVLVSTASRHYLLARIPGGSWLAALVTDAAVRLPAARLGLRDALPELTAALRVAAVGGGEA